MANQAYHGKYEDSPIYGVWKNMIARCNNPNLPTFHRYGGRGITVCERWLHFPNFHTDMIDGYSRGLTIERRKNNEGYSPDNCEWATRHDQYRNRSTNRWIETSRGPMILEDIAKIAGIEPGTAADRINNGLLGEELFQPARQAIRHDTVRGPMTTLEIAQASGMSFNGIVKRLADGVTGEALFRPPTPRGEGNRRPLYDTSRGLLTVAEIARIAGNADVSTIRLRLKRGLKDERLFAVTKGQGRRLSQN